MPGARVKAIEDRLERAEEGTAEHVDALNELAWEVWTIDVDHAADLVARAYEESKRIGYEKGFAYAQRGTGLIKYNRGEVEGALNDINSARAWFEEHGERRGEAQSCSGLAYIYWGFGEFRRGFSLAEKALEIYRELGDVEGQAWTLAALGNFYHDWNDHTKSLELYQRAHNFFLETEHVIGQARSLNGIGNAHRLLGEYDAALAYQDESLRLHRSVKNEFGESKTLNDIGLMLQSMEKYEEALEYHAQSLAIRDRRAYLQGSCTCLLDMANAYIVLRRHDDATTLLDKALVVSEKIKSKPKTRRAHELFSKLYRDLGRFDAAMIHFEHFHRLTEEVFNEDFEQKLKNLRAAHEIEASEKEAEIYRLKNVELHDKNEQLEKTLAELRTMQAQILQDAKMAALGNLVAGLVHEVNTPVGVIRSSADTALRAVERLYTDLDVDADDERSQRLRSLVDVLHTNARNALESADRIHKIAGSLKNFARLDEAPFQRVDIHEGIESTLTLIGPELRDGVRVVREFGELPRIFVYPSELNQVFMNILLNAAQALEDGGRIAIRTWADDGRVHVEVADDGKGIAPDKIERLFEPGFTRKHSTVRMRTGLYTSYNIVRNHLGDLSVQSRLGEGATFRISIPVDLEKRFGGAAS